MKAGRELDALIAEKVMGERGPFAFSDVYAMPHYSTNIADAWKVVEKFDYYAIAQLANGCHWVKVHDGNGTPFEVEAETAPLAICLAALKAVGYE